MKLNQSVPWSDEDRGGFIISAVLSPILFYLFLLLTDPASNLMGPGWMALIMFFSILIMNATPVKTLPGFVQYLICAAGVYTIQLVHPGRGFSYPVQDFFTSLLFGGMAFCAIRVHWWFLWDNSSRRTLEERILCSVVYSIFPMIAMGIGLYRLIGIGVETPTTVFVPTADGKTLEMIPENPALQDHARVVAAHKAGTPRIDALDKDSVSESL